MASGACLCAGPHGVAHVLIYPCGKAQKQPPSAALKARRRSYEMARDRPLSSGALAPARWPDELEKPDPGFRRPWLASRAGFRAVGLGRMAHVSRSDAVGLDGVSRRPIRCTASGPAAVFFRRCVVRRLALCTPSLPVAGRASDPCFGAIPHPRFLHRHAVVVLPFTLRCRHAVRGYFRHRLEGLVGGAAARLRTLRQAPAVAAFTRPKSSGYRHRRGPSSGRSAGDF